VQGLVRNWNRFTERWRYIDGRANAGVIVVLGTQLPTNLANCNAVVHFFQAYGSSAGPLHGLRIAVLTLVAALLLHELNTQPL